MLELNKPLSGGVRRIVSVDEEELANTVADPALKEEGIGCIDLGRNVRVQQLEGEETECVSKVYVPYVQGFEVVEEHLVLPTLLHKANLIIRHLSVGDLSDRKLRQLVDRYLESLVTDLGGKHGLLNRNIFGIRASKSGRFVITPNPRLKYDEVGIPLSMSKEMDIDDGDYVMIIRSPVLWEGSVLILKAVVLNNSEATWNGSLNPYCMDLMGADFDGDTIAVFKLPQDPASVMEAERLCGAAVKEYGKWSDELLAAKGCEEIDWDESEEDLCLRLLVNNTEDLCPIYSYGLGPKDFLEPDNSALLHNFKETGCKTPPPDLVNYAVGLTSDQFKKVAKDTVALMIRMKVELGIVGASTDAIVHAIYVTNKELLTTALKLKENLTQALLDSKHGSDAFSTFEVVEVFDRKSKWIPELGASAQQAVDFLVDMGLKRELVVPIIGCLWPLNQGVSELRLKEMPYYTTTKSTSVDHLLALMRHEGDSGFFGELAEATGLIRSEVETCE